MLQRVSARVRTTYNITLLQNFNNSGIVDQTNLASSHHALVTFDRTVARRCCQYVYLSISPSVYFALSWSLCGRLTRNQPTQMNCKAMTTSNVATQ